MHAGIRSSKRSGDSFFIFPLKKGRDRHFFSLIPALLFGGEGYSLQRVKYSRTNITCDFILKGY